jgi:hypothetical protein
MKSKNLLVALMLTTVFTYAQDSKRVKVSIDDASVGKVTFSPKTKKDGTLKKRNSSNYYSNPSSWKKHRCDLFFLSGKMGNNVQ